MRDSFWGIWPVLIVKGGLQITGVDERRGDEVWSEALAHEACEASFAVCEGMASVHCSDSFWEAMAREAEGWVAIHKQ